MRDLAGGSEEGRLDQGLEDLQRRRKATLMLVGGSVALALFFWLVPLVRDVDFHHRTSKSTASMGFRGLHDLLGGLGQEVLRHRRPYRELPRADESLLMVLDPFDSKTLRGHGRARFDHEQWTDLHNWVRAGGHAVVVLPTWEATDSVDTNPSLARLRPSAARGVLEDPPPGDWEVDIPDVDDGSWLHRSWFRLGDDPMLYAFDEDLGTWPTPSEEWQRDHRLFAPYWSPRPRWEGDDDQGRDEPWMQLFMRPIPEEYSVRGQLAGEPLLIRRAVGDGAVWVLSSGWPLSNLALAEGGTSWFVYLLMAEASTGFRRQILFDEFAHGDTDTRGMFGWLTESGALYPILALGILFLLAAWKGWVRIGAPAGIRLLPRRAKEEFVVGLASMLHSQGRRRFVARSLVEESRHRLETAPGFSFSERRRRIVRLRELDEAMESLQRVSYQDLSQMAGNLDRLVRDKEEMRS